MCEKLRLVKLEEYIIANGGLANFLEGLLDFAKENGFNWKDEVKRMYDDVESRAKTLYNIM